MSATLESEAMLHEKDPRGEARAMTLLGGGGRIEVYSPTSKFASLTLGQRDRRIARKGWK